MDLVSSISYYEASGRVVFSAAVEKERFCLVHGSIVNMQRLSSPGDSGNFIPRKLGHFE